MNRVFAAALLLTLLCATAFARQQPPPARLIDSFGDIYTSDIKARLDSFAVELYNAPDVRRVVALGGGRREYKMVELWLVPPGAALPAPTPTLRASRRRRRRR